MARTSGDSSARHDTNQPDTKQPDPLRLDTAEPDDDGTAGFIQIEHFLSPEDHRRVLDFALAFESHFTESQVYNDSAPHHHDPESRRSRTLHQLDDDIFQLFAPHLTNLLPHVRTELGVPWFPLGDVERQLHVHRGGGFFSKHADSGKGDIATRRISAVYYFYEQPKRFEGGELWVYDGADNHTEVNPLDNSLVLFPSSTVHEVRPVVLNDPAFSAGRFSITFWFREESSWVSPLQPEILADAVWVPVAIERRESAIRFRKYERPFHIGHAARWPLPTDVTLSLDAVRTAASAVPSPHKVAFIYHHGYAGSTLLSRLLDHPGTCLAYAEPNIHYHHYDEPVVRSLCYRTTAHGETPLIKAVPGEVSKARSHFADIEDARGVYLYAPPEEFVADTLRHDYRQDYVTKTVHNVLGIDCADPGEAAVTWWNWAAQLVIELAETHALRTLQSGHLFADLEAVLQRTWDWYGFAPRTDWAATIDRVTATHAKSGQPFSVEERHEQRRDHAAHAADWAAAHTAELTAAKETEAALARYSV